MARQLGQDRISEDFADQAHALQVKDFLTIRRSNTATLLPTMLQRVQTPISKPSRIRMVINSHHTALFTQFVELVVGLVVLTRCQYVLVVIPQRRGKRRERSCAHASTTWHSSCSSREIEWLSSSSSVPASSSSSLLKES